MARDLRGFSKDRSRGQQSEKTQRQAMSEEQVTRDVKKTIKELEGSSEDQLMARLFEEIERGKRDGTFSPEAMQDFVKNVSPMLNSQQKKRLEEIIRSL